MNRDGPGDDEFGLPVHVFERSASEQIRISLNEFRGFEYIDIRVFFASEDGYRPTRRGLTLRKDLYPELFRGIVELGGALGYDAEALAQDLDD